LPDQFPLSLTLDASHQRVKDRRMVLLAAFDDWSPRERSNVWIDPITSTAALMPSPFSSTFWNSTGGGFRRLRLSDFYVGSATGSNGNASKWYDHNRGANTLDWFVVNTTTNDALFSRDAWGANQGFSVILFPPNVGAEEREVLSLTWGAGTADELRLSVFATGRVDVYESGVLTGSDSIKGAKANQAGQTGADAVQLTVLPWRFREVLVVSNTGGGFAFARASLDDQTAEQPILPAGQLKVEIPTGAAQVQVHPVTFATSGYITGNPGTFRSIPATGRTVETFAYSIGSGVTVRLVEGDTIGTDFVPNSVRRRARVRVDLSGNGSRTPYVLGARAGIAPSTAFTSDQSSSILCSLTAFSLDVPEEFDAVRMSAVFKPERDWATTSGRTRASNRPITVSIDGKTIIEGATEPASLRVRSDDAGDIVSLEARDYSKSEENVQFVDDIPLDGMTLADALRLCIVEAGGSGSELVADAEIENFRLPIPEGRGEFAIVIRVGDRPGEWMRRILNDYAAGFFAGRVPDGSGYPFRVRRLYRSQASAATLYSRIADVPGGSGDPAYLVYRSYDEAKLEPEANGVHVTGVDPSRRRPILVSMIDQRSRDPEIPVAQRPENWLGEPRDFGFTDPSLTTLALCERVAEQLYNALTWTRWMVEIECQTIMKADGFPAWRGDAVTLDGFGIWRIVAFSLVSSVEMDGKVRRTGKYTMEFLRNA
jgi:hypothetical protein